MRHSKIATAASTVVLGLAVTAGAGCSSADPGSPGSTNSSQPVEMHWAGTKDGGGCTCSTTLGHPWKGHDAGASGSHDGGAYDDRDDGDEDGDEDGGSVDGCGAWRALHCDAGAPPPPSSDGGVPQPTTTDGGSASDATTSDASTSDAAAEAAPPPPPPPATTVSFSSQVQPIFSAHCTSCHGGGQSPTLSAGSAYGSLVNKPAGMCSALYVVPGQPAQSWLVAALTAGGSIGSCSGGFMSNHIQSADLKTITTWISEGAKNN